MNRKFWQIPVSLFLCAVFFAPLSHAVIETYQFDDNAQRKRYQVFIEELRCPKCQNQNLSGSNSPIAEDLRRELHRMILEGQGDQQVVDFMVARYGDFVLYRPPLDKNTALLWGAPAILLFIGVLVVIVFVRGQKSQQQKIALDPLKLDADEQHRLDQILNEYPGK